MEQHKNEVLPGTLNLMVLKPWRRLAHCTAMALPGASSRSAAIFSNSIKGRFIPLSCTWSRWAGLAPSGVSRKTTGGLGITQSHEPGGDSSPLKKRIGSGHPQS